MLDKAAEAVMSVEPGRGNAFDVGPECAKEIVRAALMAIREPDDVIAQAGWNAHGETPERFTAMIDAILNEGENVG